MVTKGIALSSGGGEYMGKSLHELMTMKPTKPDNRTGREIAFDVAKQMGLEVI